jgi:hypothetical protein
VAEDLVEPRIDHRPAFIPVRAISRRPERQWPASRRRRQGGLQRRNVGTVASRRCDTLGVISIAGFDTRSTRRSRTTSAPASLATCLDGRAKHLEERHVEAGVALFDGLVQRVRLLMKYSAPCLLRPSTCAFSVGLAFNASGVSDSFAASARQPSASSSVFERFQTKLVDAR